MTTPNMNLIIPVPSVTPGPLYATELVSAFDLIDAHDHTAGKGSQIPVSGIVINADLDLQSFSTKNVYSHLMINQGSTITATNALSAVAGELYFNDGSGIPVKITAGGTVNISGSGQIGGMTGTASVSFTSINEEYSFISSAGVYGKLAGSDLKIYEHVSSGNYVGLKSPTSLASSYTLIMPAALPGSTLPLTLAASGALAPSQITSAHIAPATIVNSNIASGTILGTNIASLTIATANIDNGAVTQAKRASLGQQLSAASGSFSTTSASLVDVTNLTITITSTGRPIFIGLIPGSSATSYIQAADTSAISQVAIAMYRGVTKISLNSMVTQATGATVTSVAIPVSSIWMIDIPVAGTYVYKVQMSASSSTGYVENAKLIAYEL